MDETFLSLTISKMEETFKSNYKGYDQVNTLIKYSHLKTIHCCFQPQNPKYTIFLLPCPEATDLPLHSPPHPLPSTLSHHLRRIM